MPRRLPLSPLWVVGHLAAVVAVVTCASLGVWQLRRLDERKADNARVKARITSPAPLAPEGFGGDEAVARLRYRGVRTAGRFDPVHEFLVRYRAQDGVPGYHVVTPLVTADGAVLVNRGWVPLELGERWPAPEASAPAGEVAVEGWLAAPHRSRTKPVPPDDAAAKPGLVADVSAAQLRPLLPYERVYALTLVAEGPVDRFPSPLGLPDISEGPHLSYAFQWFSFAAIAAIGWCALVARATRPAARARSASARQQPGGSAGPPPSTTP